MTRIASLSSEPQHRRNSCRVLLTLNINLNRIQISIQGLKSGSKRGVQLVLLSQRLCEPLLSLSVTVAGPCTLPIALSLSLSLSLPLRQAIIALRATPSLCLPASFPTALRKLSPVVSGPARIVQIAAARRTPARPFVQRAR
jgi:hypothetical protein